MCCKQTGPVVLSTVAAEQSVSYGIPALLVTEADEERRELTSRTLTLRPGVHLWSNSHQSDKSLWSSTIILWVYFLKNNNNKRGVSSWCTCFLKTQTAVSFYSTEFKGKGFWSFYSKEIIMGMRNDCKPTESSILSSLCLNCSCTDSTDYFTKVGMNFTLYFNELLTLTDKKLSNSEFIII